MLLKAKIKQLSSDIHDYNFDETKYENCQLKKKKKKA